MSLPIALDAMGGDAAPEAVLSGAQMALLRHPGLTFLVFGKRDTIQPYFAQYPELAQASELVHTDDMVANDEKPSAAIRQGKHSSMRLAINSVNEGNAAAAVSAGNTGALMAMSKIVYKTLPGINRPAIAALFPTMKGDCVMLDLGANVVCTARDLFQFAIMGDAYAKAVLGHQRPTIALLNIGSEEMKGHEEIKEASAMLKDSGLDIDYKGFVEGHEVPNGEIDVIVADGFTGNIALKTAEGTARLIRGYIKDAFNASLFSKMGGVLCNKVLKVVRDRLDDRKRNGAMFLGLNGITVKSHGSADAYSFCNAITVAVELATNNINAKILSELQRYDETHPEVAADPFE